jgi:hypothetical protein
VAVRAQDKRQDRVEDATSKQNHEQGEPEKLGGHFLSGLASDADGGATASRYS